MGCDLTWFFPSHFVYSVNVCYNRRQGPGGSDGIPRVQLLRLKGD